MSKPLEHRFEREETAAGGYYELIPTSSTWAQQLSPTSYFREIEDAHTRPAQPAQPTQPRTTIDLTGDNDETIGPLPSIGNLKTGKSSNRRPLLTHNSRSLASSASNASSQPPRRRDPRNSKQFNGFPKRSEPLRNDWEAIPIGQLIRENPNHIWGRVLRHLIHQNWKASDVEKHLDPKARAQISKGKERMSFLRHWMLEEAQIEEFEKTHGPTRWDGITVAPSNHSMSASGTVMNAVMQPNSGLVAPPSSAPSSQTTAAAGKLERQISQHSQQTSGDMRRQITRQQQKTVNSRMNQINHESYGQGACSPNLQQNHGPSGTPTQQQHAPTQRELLARTFIPDYSLVPPSSPAFSSSSGPRRKQISSNQHRYNPYDHMNHPAPQSHAATTTATSTPLFIEYKPLDTNRRVGKVRKAVQSGADELNNRTSPDALNMTISSFPELFAGRQQTGLSSEEAIDLTSPPQSPRHEQPMVSQAQNQRQDSRVCSSAQVDVSTQPEAGTRAQVGAQAGAVDKAQVRAASPDHQGGFDADREFGSAVEVDFLSMPGSGQTDNPATPEPEPEPQNVTIAGDTNNGALNSNAAISTDPTPRKEDQDVDLFNLVDWDSWDQNTSGLGLDLGGF